MIDRASPDYKSAKDRVKISHFIEKGYDIRGVIHVGANDGYEVQYYLKMGIGNVLCFEPLAEARLTLLDSDFGPGAITSLVHDCALGNYDGDGVLNVTAGDGKGSSLLPLPRWDKCVGQQSVSVRRFSTLYPDGPSDRYNCLVIDVQGMELDVLRGMDEHLKKFDFLSVECSAVPVYKGEATATEVIAYLDRMGFHQDSPVAAHDDVMFINRNVLHPPAAPKPLPSGTKLNCGSGQRPFGEGWINIDINPRWNPDLVADWNNLEMFEDGSMDLVVSCHSIEHAGCGESDGFIREAHRVLRDGGSLIVLVPDMKALAQRWLSGGIDEQIYMTNVYGAYMGHEEDRHRWGWSRQGLVDNLRRIAKWSDVHAFNDRVIPEADIPSDWWMTSLECVK